MIKLFVQVVFISFAGTAFLTVMPVSASPSLPEQVQGSELEQVVAEVNDVKLTRAAVERELVREFQRELDYFSDSERRRLSSRMIEKLVDRELLLQEARAQKLFPKMDEVNELLASLKRKSLDQNLEEQKISKEAFANGVREDIAIKRYLDKFILERAGVTDDEVKQEYERTREKYVEPEQVGVRQILFRVASDADPSVVREVEEKARQVLAEARVSGCDFSHLASNYSLAANADKGGKMDLFSRGQLDKEFADAAFALKIGEVSDLVRTRFGFHIIKLEERLGGKLKSFEEVREEIKARLVQERVEKLLTQELTRLRKSNRVIVYQQ